MIPKSISLCIRATQSRNPGLNSSRSATGSWSDGTVARKRLLKSIDSNSTLRRLAACSIRSSGSTDSTLKIGTTRARSGMCAFASTARGRTVFENRPPSWRSSESQEEPQNSGASCPVRRFVPPGQSATGPPRGLSPPIGS